MKKLLQLIILITIALNLNSCYYDEIFEQEIDIPEGTVVEFAADITPIFAANNCTDCHNGAQDPNLTPGNEYNSLVPEYVVAGNANNSEFYSKLSGGHANVDATSLALIAEWINSGALNN